MEIVLTVEGTGVDPTEEAMGWQQHGHGISEPVRQDKQEQGRDAQSLWLEVVDLSQDTGMMVSERHEQWRESDLRSKSGETEAEEERPEGEGRQRGLVAGGQDLSHRWVGRESPENRAH